MASIHQAAVREAMRLPAFYPHPVQSIELRETDVSMVVMRDPSYTGSGSRQLGSGLIFRYRQRAYHWCQEAALNSHSIKIGFVTSRHLNRSNNQGGVS